MDEEYGTNTVTFEVSNADQTKQAMGNDDEYRTEKTICLCISTIGNGLLAAVAGTTLTHTRLLYEATTAAVSLALTLEFGCSLVGVFASNVLIGRLKFEFLACCCVALAATMTVCASFMPVFPAFIAAVSLRGFAAGVFMLNAQTFCVDAWNGNHYKAMVTQVQNAIFSFGCFISPFLIKPFLVELAQVPNSRTTSVVLSFQTDETGEAYHGTTSNSDDITDDLSTIKYLKFTENFINRTEFGILASSDAVTKSGTLAPEGLYKLRYGYVIVGLVSLLTVLPMVVTYFRVNGAVLPYRQQQRDAVTPSKLLSHHDDCDVDGKVFAAQKNSRKQRQCSHSIILYIAVVFLIGFLFGGMEMTPMAFFFSFVVRQLSWSINDASLFVSVFYAMFCAGGLIAAILSTVISPDSILSIDVASVATGLGILLLIDFVSNLSPNFVWIASALVGFGISSGFACLVLIVSATIPKVEGSRRRPLTSTVLSAFGIGFRIGVSVFPVVVGNMFDRLSPMWMVYVLIGSVIGLISLLFVKRIIG